MAVTYKKLFHLMIDRGISNAELMEKAGFSANIITRLKRDNYLSLDTIEKICLTLNCGVDDILDFVDTNGDKKSEHLEILNQKKDEIILLFQQANITLIF